VHTTKSRGFDFQLDKRLTDIYRLIGGFNYLKNMNNSNTSGKHAYNVRAGYLENQVEITDNLLLNASARADDYSNFGTEINPGAGFIYVINEKNKLRGQISRSFRAPTFNDLYWPDEGWAKGNPDLVPEKGVSGEIGFETDLFNRMTAGITYFRSGYSNLINWAESNGVWMPQNVNSAVINGVEFENTVRMFRGWELITGYTYLRAKDNKTHTYLIYQPRHKFDCAVRYTAPDDLTVELNGRYTGQRYHDAANTIKMKDFFIFGARISKKIKKTMTVFAQIDNMLNETYQSIRDYPMPGFSITGGLKVEF
jgi:outer membrane cobalamin receptor